MRHLVGTSIVGAMLLFGGSVVGAQVSFGIHIGPPPQARVVRVQPRQPGPEYTWVEGYWYPVGNKYTWHDGYWTRPPYGGANWTPSTYDGQMYYQGYWGGDQGRVEHSHQSDRSRTRDYRDNGNNGGQQNRP